MCAVVSLFYFTFFDRSAQTVLYAVHTHVLYRRDDMCRERHTKSDFREFRESFFFCSSLYHDS